MFSFDMKEQDGTLDALSQAIRRQKDLSLTISSELELHEDLIDETDQALDRYVTFLSPFQERSSILVLVADRVIVQYGSATTPSEQEPGQSGPEIA